MITKPRVHGILPRMSTERILSVIEAEIARLQQARAILSDINAERRPQKAFKSIRPMRNMSAAARERIAAAQRKRWAALRKSGK